MIIKKAIEMLHYAIHVASHRFRKHMQMNSVENLIHTATITQTPF